MTTQRSEALDPVAVEVGAAIHSIMWRQRVTTAQLGAALGVSQSTASKKVRGLVTISVPELMTIAGVLGVDPRDLLPRLDSNQQPSGYPFSQVSSVDTPERSVCAPVVQLAEWRAAERVAS